jgi:N-acetylglucosamine kinase-like BadF-type ATPase
MSVWTICLPISFLIAVPMKSVHEPKTITMILIADSGSTKTFWSLLNDDEACSHYYTPGINPFFQTEYEIEGHLRMTLLPKLGINEITEIYFYGAGCATEKQKTIVKTAFSKVFTYDHIEVESDLLGAARALCGNKPGIACILGTGSNSCYYDGKEIVQQVSPLGYIIGDEGSGAALGKRLVADCLKNQVKEYIKERFFERFKLTHAQIIENIYSKPFPNRFLASLSVFLRENIGEPEIYKIVYDGFSDFFQRNVFQYDYNSTKVNVVGSIGFYYQDVLRQVAADLSIDLGKIIQAPTDDLITYHTSKKKKFEPTHGI